MSRHTVVVMLNASGSQELYCGWRVEELFRGRWDASASDIAAATSRELGVPLQVHALIDDDLGRQVVLRWSTAYSTAPRAALRAEAAFTKAIKPNARKRCVLSLVRDEPIQEQTSVAKPDFAPTSETFSLEDVTRVTSRASLRLTACAPQPTKMRCG